MAVIRVALQMALGIALTVLLQIALRRRLPEERRARGWNGASWGAAVYAFGPLSMLGFCWVTRAPGARGAAAAWAQGLGWTALLAMTLVGVDELLGLFLGPGSWR